MFTYSHLLCSLVLANEKTKHSFPSSVSVWPSSYILDSLYVFHVYLWCMERNSESSQQCLMKAKCSQIPHNWLIHPGYKVKGCWNQWEFWLPGLVILGPPKGGLGISVFVTLMSPKKILLSLVMFLFHCAFTCYYSLINNDTQVFTKLVLFTQSLEMVVLGPCMNFGDYV